MSRIVEGDQRLFHEKVFAKLLKAFGVTDWGLKLPNPEEKAEATRISFAQQRAQVVNQYIALGFDVRLKDDGVNLDEAEFLVFGKPVPTAQMQGEQMAMGLEQQQQQMEMMQQQQQQIDYQRQQYAHSATNMLNAAAEQALGASHLNNAPDQAKAQLRQMLLM